jgi:hypothetical protein
MHWTTTSYANSIILFLYTIASAGRIEIADKSASQVYIQIRAQPHSDCGVISVSECIYVDWWRV